MVFFPFGDAVLCSLFYNHVVLLAGTPVAGEDPHHYDGKHEGKDEHGGKHILGKHAAHHSGIDVTHPVDDELHSGLVVNPEHDALGKGMSDMTA